MKYPHFDKSDEEVRFNKEIRNMNDVRKNKEFPFKEIVSFSHILGSITSILVDYIRSAFNDQYIKTVWNTMEEPFKQRSKAFKDVLTKPRPIMTIEPRYDPSDDSEFLPQAEFDGLVANEPNSDIWISMRQSDPLIIGENFELYHKMRRMKMEFNINFIFDSDIQRIQAQQYIRMTIRHLAHNIIYRYIENNIPESFMKAIAEMNHLNYDSEEFLRFLNDRSKSPITRKMRTGSGTNEFFSMNYSPIEIYFTSLPSTNGPVKKGNLIVSSSFSENVVIEFVVDSMYFLKTNVDVGKIINTGLHNLDSETITPVGMVSADIADLVIDKPDPDKYEHGYTKLFTIALNADKNGTDSINLNDGNLLTADIRNIMEYYKNKHMEVDIFHIAVIETPSYQLDKTRFTFNQNTLELTIQDMDIYRTYYVSLYLDKQKVNKLKMAHFETDDFKRV